jgi:glutaredoxin
MRDTRTFYLYTIPECPFCHDAKVLLAEKRHRFITMELSSSNPTLERLKEEMDWGTVPMVFELLGRDHKFVGGYTDLVDYLGEENE